MQSIERVQWPGWDVVRLIGRGSFGAVYEIQRDVFGETERAALKVITIPENSADIEDLRVEGYDDESITSRFHNYLEDIVKEYSTMAKMKGHPNVVYCDDVQYIQHDDGIGWDIYIKMELLTPIMKCLDQVENEQAVIDLGIAMCNALVLCKERSIVHRDIKPQNIFVSRDGTFKLGDFGIAKTAERTTSGTKVGTYKYMAPEVYNNKPYGPAADQYSLGLVMYWLLNDRRTPFSPKRATASEEEMARKRRFDGEQIPPPAHGSKQLQAIVLKACAYDPKQRFASAAEMLKTLKAMNSNPNYALTNDSISGDTGAVGEGVVSHEENELTSGAVGNERERLAEEATIGVFGRGIKSSSPPGQSQKAQPTAQQNDVSRHIRPSQQDNKQHTTLPDTAPSQERVAEKKKRRIGAWIVIVAGFAAAIGVALLLTPGKGKAAEVPVDTRIALGDNNKQIAPANNTEQSPHTTEYNEAFTGLSIEDRKYRSIVGGGNQILGVKKEGTVVGVGSNGHGQLDVSEWTDIVAVATEYSYSIGLRRDGTVVVAGNPEFSESLVSTWTDIVDICVTNVNAIGLRSDGTVLVAGNSNCNYTQGDVSTWEGIIAIAASDQILIGLKADGTCVAVGDNSNGQCNVSDWNDIVEVYTWRFYTVGICRDGTVRITGTTGEIDVSGWRDIISVASWDSNLNYGYLVGLRSDGTVVASGDNNYGQCNVSSWSNVVKVCVVDYCTVGLCADGTVLMNGYDIYERSAVKKWTDIVDITVNYGTICGLKKDGSAVSTGPFCDVSSWKDLRLPT